MSNINNSTNNSDLWLQNEEIKDRLAILLQKLQALSSAQNSQEEEFDFSSLVEDIQTLLTSESTDIQALISALQTAVQTNGGTLTSLAQSQEGLGTQITNAKNSIITAIQALSSLGDSPTPAEPFTLDFNTVYGTSSSFKSLRSFYSTTSQVKTAPEHFIMNANSPAYLLLQYDFTIATAQDVIIQVYVNGVEVYTQTVAMASGTTNHVHHIMFEPMQSNCKVYVTATTVSAIAKQMSNISMQLVGNNALFLREMPSTIYSVFPINYDVYLTRLQNNTCDYKIVNINTLDFSANYTTLIQTTSDKQIFPYLLMNTSISQRTATLVQFTYILFDVTNKYLYFYDSSTGTSKKSIQTRENYNNITQYIYFDPYYDDRLSCRFNMIAMEDNEIYSYTSRGLWATAPANNQTFYLTIRQAVQLVGATSCLTACGVGSISNTVFLMQDDTGTWRMLTTSNFVSESVTYTIGVGTRASIALCPSLTTDNTNVNNVYRVFMCSYGTWYAYYLRLDANAITLLKTEIISGDYDQIIAGNSNIYFKIKNGAITPVVDTNLHSISEMTL